MNSHDILADWHQLGKNLETQHQYIDVPRMQLPQHVDQVWHMDCVSLTLSWDPGGSFRQPAWGQADFQGGGNVTDRVHMRWTGTWAGLSNGADLLMERPKLFLLQYKEMSCAREKGSMMN